MAVALLASTLSATVTTMGEAEDVQKSFAQLQTKLASPSGKQMAKAVDVLDVGKDGSVKRDKVEKVMPGLVEFLLQLDEDKETLDALVAGAVFAGKVYLGAMSLLEAAALVAHRKGWAKKIRRADKLSSAMRSWHKKPDSKDKLIEGLTEEFMQKLADAKKRRKKAAASKKKKGGDSSGENSGSAEGESDSSAGTSSGCTASSSSGKKVKGKKKAAAKKTKKVKSKDKKAKGKKGKKETKKATESDSEEESKKEDGEGEPAAKKAKLTAAFSDSDDKDEAKAKAEKEALAAKKKIAAQVWGKEKAQLFGVFLDGCVAPPWPATTKFLEHLRQIPDEVVELWGLQEIHAAVLAKGKYPKNEDVIPLVTAFKEMAGECEALLEE